MTTIKKSYVAESEEDIRTALSNLIGKTVCVSWVCGKSQRVTSEWLGGAEDALRHNFEPQISVQEKLEGSSETGKFRVLINDNTYSYFFNEYVWLVVHDVDKNKRPVIYIR
jgi:hypothetical protein